MSLLDKPINVIIIIIKVYIKKTTTKNKNISPSMVRFLRYPVSTCCQTFSFRFLLLSDMLLQNHIFANAFHLCRIFSEILDKFVEGRKVSWFGTTYSNEVFISAVHGNVSEFGFSIRGSYADVEFSHIQSRADQECPFVIVRVQQVFSLGAGD